MGKKSSQKHLLAKYFHLTRSRLKLLVTAIALILCIILLRRYLFPKRTPVITTANGQVQGRVGNSRNGLEYWQFLGIPYAKPPLGHLKFQPPVPAAPWVGVRSAISGPPFCVQFDTMIFQVSFGQEDCLYLNVYTHPFNQTTTPKRPVMVHLHGGGYLMGGSYAYGPENLMDHSNVVVTFNYRLGPFGFLNFDHDPKIDGVPLPRGNMGIKDQLLVLKWVQSNIANFGGDPNQVTIFGESAGGASVHLHILSPKSHGLFHRAYSHSGVSYCSWGFTSKPRETAMEYAKRWNCPLNDTRALLDCIENLDPWEMVKFQISSTDPAVMPDNLSPSVESVESDDRFLAEHPMEIMQNGKFAKVPYMLGVNSADGALRLGRFEGIPERVEMLQQNWTGLIGYTLLIDNLTESNAYAIKNYYFKNANDYRDPERFKDKLAVMFSDIFAFEPVERAAKWHAKTGVETHLLYFNYTPKSTPSSFSVFRAYHPDRWVNRFVQVVWQIAADWVTEYVFGGKGGHRHGACHAEEALQLWNAFGISEAMSYFEKDFSQSFVQMIVDFSKGGKPVQFRNTELPQVNNSKGTISKENSIAYMLVDDSVTGKVISDPYSGRLDFWRSIGVTEFNRKIVGNKSW